MKRWNSFVNAYKNSGLLNESEYYVSNINAGSTDVDAGAQWDWPFFYIKVTCSYSINFNKNGANSTGSKVGDSTFFEYIEF